MNRAVLLDIADGIATITLNRPDAANAIDPDLAAGFRAAVTRLSDGNLPRVIVLTAAGRIFCGGGDVRRMASATDRARYLAELAGTMHEALAALRALPVPVVASVPGTVAGAGLGLVLAADVVVAVETARFVSAYSAIGLSPDCGVTALLPATIGPRRAAELILRNRRLDAATALDWGLVSEVCAPGDLAGRTTAIATDIAALPGTAAGESARLLRQPYHSQLADEARTISRLGELPAADALIRAFS
ncbi:MAG TPA: enoyl-CoA hydratase/isomerase family protein [Pseudonocardiaceae bacterium]|jgi:2-(1,2-epoxy-1,2-dihydrophenyl)acetyl-CoA isomerase|nr:enoyl-CoA hydratase/isomerase family protein [Pseudonocardiaceae bacterium]